jgi:site-specific DNA recombinase
MPSTNGHGPQSGAEKVALCLRVSSEEQRDRETIEIQREFLEQYCALYGLYVAGMYADDGVSGTVPLHERPEGRRLVEDAKAGKFDTVLVYKLDRLGRSLLVIVDAHDRLQAAGVSLRSATEPIDTSTASGRLIFQMLASFAEYERETIRERTRAGLHRAYRGGRHMGAVPYGYRADEHGRLEIVPEEAEVVREVVSNVADGATLYAEAKRLNDLGVPAPGWRYVGGKRRPGSRAWSVTTITRFVHMRVYSGPHEVRIDGGEGLIERGAPAVVEAALQERALAALTQNKRYPNRKADRNYLLSGLVKCEACGSACTGHPATTRKGAKYHYYVCRGSRTNNFGRGRPHRPPYLNAKWLEGLVWADVRRFIEDPGEVLERVREQIGGDYGADEELEARREELAKRLAGKQAEKDRYVRAYAQEHISEEELDVYLADLKNQTDNLRLLLSSVEADLSHRRQRMELTEATRVWLAALKQRVAEIEEDTEDAFRVCKQLVKLLVAKITARKRHEDGGTEVRITYRFGPPPGGGGLQEEGGSFVGSLMNGSRS